jgi:hypothetical protein
MCYLDTPNVKALHFMPKNICFVIAILVVSGCGVAVRPDGGADGSLVDAAAADADSSRDSNSSGDVHTASDGDADASDQPLGPATAIVNITNTLSRSVFRDNIEAMHFLVPFAPVRGAWTEVSGRCLVDQIVHPAFDWFANRVQFRVAGNNITPTYTRDGRFEWKATEDSIVPGTDVSVTAENPMWMTPWSVSVVVPPLVAVESPPAEFFGPLSDTLRVRWLPSALPPSAVVEVRLVNLLWDAGLGVFNVSALRCEYTPQSGESQIRLADHPRFRVWQDMRDNILLSVNVLERKLVPSEGGPVEVVVRSESALIPVTVR